VADLLLVSEPSGVANLRREGVPDAKVRLVGNVMIDTLLTWLDTARSRSTATGLGLAARKYGFITLHLPSNVDDPPVLGSLVELFQELAGELPLVFAVHPRTLEAAGRAGLRERLAPGQPGLICVAPLPYLDTISLVAGARVVLTDSGGLQEETAVLGVPCLTLRENTERPVTIELGTSRLVGSDPERIREAFRQAIDGAWPAEHPIPHWDGQAGPRVARELAMWLALIGRCV